MTDAVNLLITIPFSEQEKPLLDELGARFPNLNIIHHPIQKGEEVPDELWGEAEIIYAFQRLPQAELARKVRWIQFHLAGIDNFIDHPLLRRENVKSTTLSGANAPQVAEHALALMLALAHNIPTMLADQSRARWATQRLERYQPSELYGATLGIVGFGSVGNQLARLVRPFGMKVLASKRDLLDSQEDEGYRVPDPNNGERDEAAALADRLYPGKAIRNLFKDCDFVAITVPLTEETRGLIGEKQLEALPPHAFLVDVSRGGVVDHDALAQALRNETLAGAGLDVFPGEPLPADSPLWEMPNVIISPHVAGLSPHYTRRAMALFAENLERYFAGDKLLNEVDLQRGY